MNISQFREVMQYHFERMTDGYNQLFEVSLDKDELWELYLDSFPEGTNEIFRERREYDCSCCRNFIKTIGNVVTIENGQVKTLWDFETGSTTFQPVVDSLSTFVKSKIIKDVWVTKEAAVGTHSNFELMESGDIHEWHHLHVGLPHHLRYQGDSSVATVKGDLRDTRNVFKRSLDEITEDSVETVMELIYQKSLYRGEEWRASLQELLYHLREYNDIISYEGTELYAWENFSRVSEVVGRILNRSMGTLLSNISQGMDLDTAVRKYEAIVAPENYKRPKPIYTKKMAEEAINFLRKEGYEDSMYRRFARLDDISVKNIFFSNRDVRSSIAGGNVFDDLLDGAVTKPKKFSRVTEVWIDDFVNNILPTAKEVEVYLENRLSNNMVSLIAPKVPDSKTLFKWDNPFSWSYTGNITDSSMKERVKSAGGDVDGVLRFSIQWNDGDEYDSNDLDAHCIEPNGKKIYFGNNVNGKTTGKLDVDIIDPERGVPAVENITWTELDRMERGTYTFSVHNFDHCGGKGGFRAEIEFDGQIHSFEYNQDIRNKEEVIVAEVTLDSTGFSIKERLPSSLSSKTVWNLKTEQFIPVSVITHSPNYWGDRGVGQEHVFFMLKNCINPETPNGIYNEFLKEDFMNRKRVFEALGSKTAVEPSDDQLSGIGFSTTKRNEVIVKVTGQTERVLKIKI